MSKEKEYAFPVHLGVYGYNEQTVREKMEFQKHNSLELYYLVSGEIEVGYKNSKTGMFESFRIFPGNFILIKPNVVHALNSNTSVKYFVMEFLCANRNHNLMEFLQDSDYVNSFPEAIKLINEWQDILVLKDTQNILNLINKFRSLVDKSQPDRFYHAHLEIRLKQLFLFIIQSLIEEAPDKQTIHLKRALSFLQSNYERSITVADISKHLGISATHIQRIFKEAFSKPVIDKLNEIRINKAVSLLLDSNYSIKTISKMTGFNSVQAFQYNFKKIKSVSPQKYKSENLTTKIRVKNINDEFYYVEYSNK